MKGEYILAHDLGTAGDKVVLTDLRGNIILSRYLPYAVEYPQPQWAEQDPEDLWEGMARNTRQLIEEAGIDPGAIAGVGISAQMFNLLPVSEEYQPLMKMISWLDVRSTRQADRAIAEIGADFFFRKTGNVPTAKDIIPKILWLREERPDLWARTYKLLDCQQYVTYRLTGSCAIDWHGASVFFLFDPHNKTWLQEMCDALGIPMHMLPDPYPCAEIIGEVTPEAARATGLSPGTPVVMCAGDLGSAQVGAGAVGDNKVQLCVSTATWVSIASSRFVNDPQKPLWVLNHVDPQRWVIAGEMETGGGSLMWFRDVVFREEGDAAEKQGLSAYKMLDDMVEDTEPGADRLIFAPWLSGERAPVLDHYARGAFVGLSLSHTKAHMARAVMEGVAYHLRWIMEALEKLGLRLQSVNAIGGGSTSATWTRIISDVTGRELRVVDWTREAGAVGAALTTAVGLGIYPNVEAVDDLVRFKQVIQPSGGENQERYESYFREYKALYESLAPIYRRMHRIV